VHVQHPGNLLRTADGKLVILDFGLMTEVQPGATAPTMP
jgi:predicted unusual protein kinase regulating ubiquinone biosynthesis (AarF/ABC1/UbiB family)